MTVSVWTKAPGDLLDFDLRCNRWLTAGDRVSMAVVNVIDSTATIARVEWTDDLVKSWIGGGSSGEAGTVVITITTAQGRTKVAALRLRVQDP